MLEPMSVEAGVSIADAARAIGVSAHRPLVFIDHKITIYEDKLNG
jgi:hypothetical protein